MSYLTSGRDLLRMQVPRVARSNPVIVADPLFGEPAPPAGPTARLASGRGDRPGRPAGPLDHLLRADRRVRRRRRGRSRRSSRRRRSSRGGARRRRRSSGWRRRACCTSPRMASSWTTGARHGGSRHPAAGTRAISASLTSRIRCCAPVWRWPARTSHTTRTTTAFSPRSKPRA